LKQAILMTSKTNSNKTAYLDRDILIIGSGAAGLTLALRCAEFSNVAVISKGSLREGATFYAQGGIAAVLDDHDSIHDHVTDTLTAGVGLCHNDMVEFVVSNSNECIRWLVGQGVPFTTKDKPVPLPHAKTEPSLSPDDLTSLHLTKEGGHSHRRIIHATDATGKAVFNTLQKQALSHNNIQLFENHIAVDLLTRNKLGLPDQACVGAYIMDSQTRKVRLFRAKFVVLATGGASKAYLYTTNPDGASGDGIAMAWRAGCRVANMEFNQFHPTCLFHPHAKSFLITEALRGEGAYLELPDGNRFMQRFDARLELAPRDIVARAIDHEMKRLGCDCVYLNISHKPREFILSHFPTIYERCLKFAIDICEQRIPVVPAAHYTCGGVMVNKQGETDIPNLYAIGETSFTGLHGANRMASNSLLECFVLAFSASRQIEEKIINTELSVAGLPWDESNVNKSEDEILISHDWDELRRFMWDFVGIVRTDRRLQRAKQRIQVLELEIQEYYKQYKISTDLLELRNLILVAKLIIDSALSRKESRGLHYTLDYPELADNPVDTVLIPTGFRPPS